jgi:hypothetical protein
MVGKFMYNYQLPSMDWQLESLHVGVKVAIVSRKISDLNGQEGGNTDFATVIVRQHPSLSEPKVLDVLTVETEQFKEIGDLVVLEVQMPNGSKRDVAMRLADFNKLNPNMEKVLQDARGTRGRVPGTRVGNGNGNG